jgi:hypothetical protein
MCFSPDPCTRSVARRRYPEARKGGAIHVYLSDYNTFFGKRQLISFPPDVADRPPLFFLRLEFIDLPPDSLMALLEFSYKSSRKPKPWPEAGGRPFSHRGAFFKKSLKIFKIDLTKGVLSLINIIVTIGLIEIRETGLLNSISIKRRSFS